MNKKKFEFGKIRLYLLVIIFLFFTLPLILIFLPNGLNTAFLEMQLISLNPIVIFIMSLMFALKEGFTIKLPLFIGLSFLIAVFFYYSPQELVYPIVYFIFSLIGALIGKWLSKYFVN